ncbi:hypothetical protein RZS08_56955, partial [Arthrospira platensis SPKY1]|nr:hypothetical protein [Arthrospira platensis SPKY1]
VEPGIRIGEALRQRKARRLRHVRIHEQEIERITAIAGRNERGEHCIGAGCGLRPHRQRLQQPAQHGGKGRVARADQHPRAAQVRRVPRPRIGDALQRQRE